MSGLLLAADSSGLPQPNFGCGSIITDPGCNIQESLARTVVSVVGGLGNFIADMVVNAFKGATISSTSWSVVSDQFWFWAFVMGALVVTIMIFQIGVAAILGDHRRMVHVTIGGLVAVPVSVFAVDMMEKLVPLGDDITNSAVSGIQHNTLAGGLLKVLGVTSTGQSGTALMGSGSWTQGGQISLLMASNNALTGLGQIIVGFLLTLLMALAAGTLYMLMQIRDLGLMALGAMAPIALMFIGQPVLAAWGKRWINLAIGLLLAKPLAAGVMVLLVNILATSNDVGTLLVVSIGIGAAAFSPFWAVSLVSFAEGQVGNALTRRGSTTQQINKASTVIRLVGKVRK